MAMKRSMRSGLISITCRRWSSVINTHYTSRANILKVGSLYNPHPRLIPLSRRAFCERERGASQGESYGTTVEVITPVVKAVFGSDTPDEVVPDNVAVLSSFK